MEAYMDTIKQQYSELHYYMYKFPKEFHLKLHEAIHCGFPIDYVDERGRTLLSRSVRYACHDAKNTTYMSILDYGANPNISDDTKRSALEIALGCYMQQTKYKLVSCLVKSGADVNIIDKRGNSLLHLVIYHGHSYSILECLLKAGANVNVLDSSGYTVFSELARDYIYGPQYKHNNILRAIRLVLKYGADPYLSTKWLETKRDIDEETYAREKWLKLLCDRILAKRSNCSK